MSMRPSDIQEMPDENAEPKEDDEKKTKKKHSCKGRICCKMFFCWNFGERRRISSFAKTQAEEMM